VSATSAITYPPAKARHRLYSESRPPPPIGQGGRSVSTSALDERTMSTANSEAPTVRLVHHADSQDGDSIAMTPLSRESTATSTPSTLVSCTSGDSLRESSEDSRFSTPSIPEEEPVPDEEKIEAKPQKQPEISWFLTIFLLLSVTMVSAPRLHGRQLLILAPPVCVYHRRLDCGVHGWGVKQGQQGLDCSYPAPNHQLRCG
jgi:Ca2+:H+ antiporter